MPSTTSLGLDILPLTPESPDRLLRGAHAVDVQFWEDELAGLEPPSFAETLAELDGELGAHREGLVAVSADGHVVADVQWTQPLLEDTDLALAWIVVDRAHRRRGIARQLYAAFTDAARSAGVRRVETSVRVGSAGSALAASLGGAVGQVELCNVLHLDDHPLPDLPTVPDGYELRTWSGPAPDDLVDALAAAHSAMDDAPHEGLAHEKSVWTADRLRSSEQHLRRAGFQLLTAAAVHVASGEVGGYTDLVLTGRPSTATQEDTGVVRRHRGHGLGLLLKVANLRRLVDAHPEIRTVVTWNAESNAHMLAINDAIGFRPHSRWEQTTTTLSGH